MADNRVGELDGVGGRLFYRACVPDAPAAALLFIHGLGDHSGWFTRVGEIAGLRGYAWSALDLRGHGRSDGRRGHADALRGLLEDVDRFRTLVAGDRPAVMIGHSLGGLLTLRYAQTYPGTLLGAVLVAPFLGLATEVPRWKRLVGAVADRLAPALTLDHGLIARDLIRDPAALAEHDADPLVHRRISARLWSSVLTQQAAARAAPPETPLLFQLAGVDRAVSTEVSLALARAWQATATCLVYAESYHDLYHDPVAARAVGDALDWIDALLRRPAAAARARNLQQSE